MCGIFLCLCGSQEQERSWEQLYQDTFQLLSSRGPDCSGVSRVPSLSLYVRGEVLWLRGDRPAEQPLQSDESVLLWNGDIFGGAVAVPSGQCDTQALKEVLDATDDSDIPSLMASIHGPYAFAYVRISSRKIWFGRDYFGRHCLLIGRSASEFFLTSITSPEELPCTELPALGVYEVTISSDGALLDEEIRLRCWNPFLFKLLEENKMLDSRIRLLDQSPLSTSISQFNFEATSSENKQQRTVSDLASDILQGFIQDNSRNLTTLKEVLSTAVRVRVDNQPEYCKLCVGQVLQDSKRLATCSHTRIGVLFSGGLDSVVIAALVDEILPEEAPIDLLNVAFQQQSSDNGCDKVPDRITGLQALEELRLRNPDRIYNFVKVDICREELASERTSSIQKLLYPLETVLDDSIGCALWFAARGHGQLLDGTAYQSPARVMLLGMGADEQFGGYSRHRAKLSQGGENAMALELHLEICRISERNLGRDNRIVASHGLAPRCPYLDENVVSFLNSLPVEEKVDLFYPRGVGEKILLRALAFQLGLRKTATEPKRAIQFGSRIAKLENRKEKGSDKAVRK